MNITQKSIIICFLWILNTNASIEPNNYFQKIYPLQSFKKVVDTCMRLYTDILILQDQVMLHEKCDEQVDLIVGRLMRLKSYTRQLINAYLFEATVTFDELEYLLRMLEYLEVTIAENNFFDIAQSLNTITNQLKDDLKQTLYVSWSPMQVLLLPGWYQPLTNHLLLFA